MAKLYKFIIYSGIIAFFFMVVAVAGVIIGLDFRIHKYAGMLAFVFACLHVGLIIYKNFKIKASRKTKEAKL